MGKPRDFAVQAIRSPLHRFTYCRENPSRECGLSEEGFVDAFNTQMLSLSQSG
jgi:hypothetical protein